VPPGTTAVKGTIKVGSDASRPAALIETSIGGSGRLADEKPGLAVLVITNARSFPPDPLVRDQQRTRHDPPDEGGP